MNDLIYRQDAIDALAKFVPYAIDDMSTESYTNGLTDAYNLICQLPSADAVEVVRCKDCKYGEYRQDFDDYECGVDGCGLVYDADFYCSDGERREP